MDTIFIQFESDTGYRQSIQFPVERQEESQQKTGIGRTACLVHFLVEVCLDCVTGDEVTIA